MICLQVVRLQMFHTGFSSLHSLLNVRTRICRPIKIAHMSYFLGAARSRKKYIFMFKLALLKTFILYTPSLRKNQQNTLFLINELNQYMYIFNCV